jgi:hypothetical protein
MFELVPKQGWSTDRTTRIATHITTFDAHHPTKIYAPATKKVLDESGIRTHAISDCGLSSYEPKHSALTARPSHQKDGSSFRTNDNIEN